jgi:hypothetical protein
MLVEEASHTLYIARVVCGFVSPDGLGVTGVVCLEELSNIGAGKP